MFSWAKMSRMTDSRITKPKLARSCLVKTVVCVKNPGPTADVAIRKAAPNMTDDSDLGFAWSAIDREYRNTISPEFGVDGPGKIDGVFTVTMNTNSIGGDF